MSKGLKSLHNISLFQFKQKDQIPFYIKLNECFKEDFDIIEKELKALEIIKKLLIVDNDKQRIDTKNCVELSDDEWELLIEVLE